MKIIELIKSRLLSESTLPAVLFLTILGRILSLRHGHYYFDHVIMLTILMIYFFSTGLKKSLPAGHFTVVLLIVWCYFTFILNTDTGLTPGPGSQAFLWIRILAGINLVFAVMFVLLYMSGRLPSKAHLFMVFPVLTFIAGHILVIFATPLPDIDVYTIMTKGADLMIHGQNPYDYFYPDIYHGEFAKVYGTTFTYPYWPVVVITTSLSHLAGFDVRAVHIIGLILTLWGLYKLSGLFGFSSMEKMLVLLVWISFPVTFFELERAWIEGIYLPAVVFLVYFMFRKKWILAGLMGALIAASKQYNLFILAFALLYTFRAGTWRAALKFALPCFVGTIILFAPFILWNPAIFYWNTFGGMLVSGTRLDSLSMVALIGKRLSVIIGGLPTMIIYLAAFTGCGLLILRRKKGLIKAFWYAMIVMYSTVFLFGKQSFNNYYYLLAFMILCFIVSDRREEGAA